MPNYRRAFAPGGCRFFTANLLDRRSSLLTDQIVALRDAARKARSRVHFRISGLFLVFVVLCLSNHVEAQERAKQAAQQPRTATWQGVPLDELIEIQTGSFHLRVQAGYIWPQPGARGQINKWPGIAFTFWMPGQAYVDLPPLTYVGLRPNETGRSRSPDRRSVVVISALYPLNSNDPTESPQKSFENLVSSPGISSFEFKEEFGLLRFWQKNWPYPQPEPFDQYRQLDDSETQILLRCTPHHARGPFPSCSGIVAVPSKGFGFRLRFSRDELREWKSIVESVNFLFEKWNSEQ